ncbi:alpha/beta fold hydrolase [Variovorax sp. GB1P17]|uniref:alpha/beta fold hydrolase n=1 Tax=Variovorax sp. GB1P17 TaxID=3443740 RepID=UPI003F48695D
MVDRRAFIASSAALAAGCATTDQSGGAKAKTYVLVHGGFHGGWCWREVARRLRAEGHAVFTPTQTGMGEREHLLTPETGIATFVDDIVRVIECEELSDIILVGHSFGGLTTSGAADRMSDRIRHAVYLDALVPEPGESVFGQFPKELVAERMKLTFEHRGVRCFRPFAPEAFGVTNPVDAAWLRRRLTPHPVKTYIDALVNVSGPASAAADGRSAPDLGCLQVQDEQCLSYAIRA